MKRSFYWSAGRLSKLVYSAKRQDFSPMMGGGALASERGLTNTSAIVSKGTVYLLDTSFFIFRAYHALPPLTTSKGVPTNAVHGVATMLERLIRERRPTLLGACFDTSRATFRRDLYPAYKANRLEPDEELRVQFPLVRRLVAALEIPILDREGFEADDILATLAKRFEDDDYDVVLVTGDKDLMQCVTDRTSLMDPMRNLVVKRPEVFEKFGVGPEAVPDVLGFMGDSSDNIPGVKGVGPKTASALIAHFGSMEATIARSEEIEGLAIRGAASVRRKIEEGVDIARLCRVLAEVRRDVPVEVRPEDLHIGRLATPELEAMADELEMHRVVARMRGLANEIGSSLAPPAPRPPSPPAPPPPWPSKDDGQPGQQELRLTAPAIPLRGRSNPPRPESKVATEPNSENPGASVPPDAADFARAIEGFGGRLLRVAHCEDADGGWTIGVEGEGLQPLSCSDPAVIRTALAGLSKRGLPKHGVSLVGHDLKALVRQFGATLGPVGFDLGVASYLCDPEAGDHSREDVCARFLTEVADETPTSATTLDQVRRAAEILEGQLEGRELTALYRKLEHPLISILGAIEAHGVLLDSAALAEMSTDLEQRMSSLVEKIYEAAECRFNVLSPMQLREILFDKLGLPSKGVKKTKTGLSTDSDVLELLSPLHPLPALVLEYRGMAKLKSTYVDALPRLADKNGRIHTRLHQTVTATGRLSSSDPNLQNIPVRTPEGAKIRAAFVAPPGSVLISADYNQIELRVLAHLCADENLIEAFRSGQDIHTATSADIFEVGIEAVTSAMRREAKVVNYGIVYGMGPQRLSRELGITRPKAEDYIKRYFEKYPKVKQFYGQMLEHARDHSFVSTLMGRRRYLPDILSDHGGHRQMAERVATNTPIQGSAADIIKKAMVDLDAALAGSGLGARLILQIHDELLLEAPASEVEDVSALLVRVMEGAASLLVPIVVDVGCGPNWGVAH